MWRVVSAYSRTQFSVLTMERYLQQQSVSGSIVQKEKTQPATFFLIKAIIQESVPATSTEPSLTTLNTNPLVAVNFNQQALIDSLSLFLSAEVAPPHFIGANKTIYSRKLTFYFDKNIKITATLFWDRRSPNYRSRSVTICISAFSMQQGILSLISAGRGPCVCLGTVKQGQVILSKIR